MRKTKIEEYNYFICPECDGVKKLSGKEFKKHLVEVHHIWESKGTRTMMMHADATDWFTYIYEWTIGGKHFTQHTKQARRHRFMF